MSISINTAGAAASGSAAISMQDFLKILLTQLTYQDPLKPMDNQAFMAQMAQFTALQQTQEINTKVEQLIANQAALQSVGLIGHTVDVSSGTSTATGVVVALSLQGSSPQLTVRTDTGVTLAGIDLTRVLSVR